MWQSHKASCFSWSSAEVGSTDVLAGKCKQAKKSESSFFQCPYVGLQQKVWPRLKILQLYFWFLQETSRPS